MIRLGLQQLCNSILESQKYFFAQITFYLDEKDERNLTSLLICQLFVYAFSEDYINMNIIFYVRNIVLECITVQLILSVLYSFWLFTVRTF